MSTVGTTQLEAKDKCGHCSRCDEIIADADEAVLEARTDALWFLAFGFAFGVFLGALVVVAWIGR